MKNIEDLKEEEVDCTVSVKLSYIEYALRYLYNSHNLLIATPFGIITGEPILQESTDDCKSPKTPKELAENHFFLISKYDDFIFAPMIAFEQGKISKDDFILRPPIDLYSDVLILKDATLDSQGKTYHLPSITIFVESILGISFIPKEDEN